MRDIVINQSMPILDASLKILKCFDASKKLKLSIPLVKKNWMVGLTIDAATLLSQFTQMKTVFYFDGQEYYLTYKENPERYLEVHLDSSIPYGGLMKRRGCEDTLLVNKLTKQKVAAGTLPIRNDEKNKIMSRGRSMLEEVLSKKEILLPETDRTKVTFAYSGPFSFKVFVKYQNILGDPVSFRDRHELNSYYWRIFAFPTYWNNRRLVLGLAFDILLGKTTRENVLEMLFPIKEEIKRDPRKYKKLTYNREMLEKELEESEKRALVLTQAALEHEELEDAVIKEGWCNERYARFYISHYGKGLLHYRNFQGNELDKFIYNYNDLHAQPNHLTYASREGFREFYDFQEEKTVEMKKERELSRQKRKLEFSLQENDVMDNNKYNNHI